MITTFAEELEILGHHDLSSQLMRVESSYFKMIKIGGDIIEIFKNPDSNELRQCTDELGDVRGIMLDEDMLIWSVNEFKTTVNHSFIVRELNLRGKAFADFYIYPNRNKIEWSFTYMSSSSLYDINYDKLHSKLNKIYKNNKNIKSLGLKFSEKVTSNLYTMSVAQTEYHKQNYQFQWIQPTFKKEANESFRNSMLMKNLSENGLSFEDENSMVEFFKSGNFRQLDRARLTNHVENMDLNDKEFKLKLNDSSYLKQFNDLQKKLEKYGRIRLDCPILINFGSYYYLMSGNISCNLAFKFNKPIKFWIADASDWTTSHSENTGTESESSYMYDSESIVPIQFSSPSDRKTENLS